MAEEKESEWTLYYHRYGFGGRGSIIRMAFALADIKYAEGDVSEHGKIKGADIDGFPNFAFPIVKHGDQLLSQTPAIIQYILAIGKVGPTDPLKAAQAMQVALTAADVWSEWFGKQDPPKEWITKRVYDFCKVLNNQLKRNNDGKGFYFGDKPCIADIFVADFMRRFELVRPQIYKAMDYPELKAHCIKFEQYEPIKKYLESDAFKKHVSEKNLKNTGKMGFLAY
eukprot:512595_1